MPSSYPSRLRRGLLLFTVLVLSACSTDPNARKQAYLKSGEKYYKAGKYQEAVIEFRNAIQIDPRFGVAHWKLGEAYLKLGHGEAAYHELANTVSLDPNNADAYLDLAGLLLSRRQLDEAQAAVDAALKIQPNSIQAHVLLSQKYTLAHDGSKAISELQKVIAADPGRVEAYVALGSACLANGQMAQGEAAYKKAVENNPKSLQAHVALGQFWFSQRNIAEAESEMRVAVKLDSRAVLPRLFLAQICLASNRPDDAEREYRELKTVAPDDPSAYQGLASFYLSTGQKQKAASELESVLSAKPKDIKVKSKLIEVLIDLNRTDRAHPLNQEILRQNPTNAPALLSESRMLLAAGKYPEADRVLESAVKSDPNCARCYYLLGIVQNSLQLADSAKASFTRARALAPQIPDTAAALAHLDVKAGDYVPALQLAGNALEANPELVSAYVTEARALIAQGALPQAEKQLEQALKRDAASLPAVATMLGLYMREGKTQAALARIAPLAAQYPQNASLQVLLGVAYLNLKDLDHAAASARRAISVDPKAKDAYTLQGNIDLARGQTEQAKSDFRAAIAADPRSLGNYLALEAQYEKEANWDEAKKLCEKTRQMDSASPVVAFRLAHLYLDHGGDVNMAVSLAQIAKQKMPDAPAASDVLGWAYYKIGSPDAAVTQLQECVAKAPHVAAYQYHLGMALLAAGRSELAAQSLKRALATDTAFPDAAQARTALAQATKHPRSAASQ